MIVNNEYLCDIMNEWYRAITDRVKSPFYWGFIFSWCIVNWRVFLIIINPKAYGCNNGINTCIDCYLFHYNKYWSNTLWLPLFLAFVYTVAVPFIDRVINNFHRNNITHDKKTLVTGLEVKRRDDRILFLKKEIAQKDKEYTDISKNLETERTNFEAYKTNHQYAKDYDKTISEIFGNDIWEIEYEYVEKVREKYKFEGDKYISKKNGTDYINEFRIMEYKYRKDQLILFAFKLPTNIEAALDTNDAFKDEFKYGEYYFFYFNIVKQNIMKGFRRELKYEDYSTNETIEFTMKKEIEVNS